jgi:hypothetical protein
MNLYEKGKRTKKPFGSEFVPTSQNAASIKIQ